MPPRFAPPAYFCWTVFVFYCLFALVYVVGIAWEAVPRLRAGPIRFRLPLASLTKPLNVTVAAFGFSLFFFLLFLPHIWFVILSSNDLFLTFIPLLFLWLVVSIRLGGGTPWWLRPPRCDAKPWRVLASGLLALVMGAVALGFGLWVLQAGDYAAGHPAGPLILVAVIAFVMGAATLQVYMSGVRVRERGIEILGTFLPWSRVVVKDWYPREAGFDLALSIRSPRLFGMRVMLADGEVIVPVPVSERPALEVFLDEHSATAG